MSNALFARAEGSRERYRALFQFVCFVILIVAAGVVVSRGTTYAMQSIFAGRQLSRVLVTGPAGAAAVLLATYIMARVSDQPFTKFGLGGRHRLRNFAVGLVAGIALVAVLLLAIHALGGFTFGPLGISGPTLLAWSVLCGIVFLGVAVTEEFIFRSFGLVTLSRAISFWPASILLAALFGAAHLGNSGEGAAGALAAAVFAVDLAVSFRWTGSLWYALGIHTGFGYAESFLFGVPNSGNTLTVQAMHSTFHGPVWLTGGSIGPEGSALVAIPLVLIIAIAWFLRERDSQAGVSR